MALSNYRRGLAASLLLLGSASTFANNLDLTIAATNSFTVARSPLGGKTGCSIKTGAHPYASIKFTAPTTGTYNLAAISSEGMDNDTYIALYSSGFDPANPTTGLLLCNDDIGKGDRLSKLTPTLSAGGQYELMVTSYFTAKTGSARVAFSPDVTLGAGTGVSKTAQTVLFAALSAKTFGAADVTLSASASSGLPVTFNLAASSSGCSLNGTVVKITGVGTCALEATQAGNALYSAATPATQRFSIGKAAQTVVFEPATEATVGISASLTASGGASGNTVSFASATPSVCAVDGATLNFSAAGTCSVTANQAGNDKYEAAPQVSANIHVAEAVIVPQEQNLSMTLNPNEGIVGEVLTVSATPGESGNAVTFAGATPEVCSVQGSSVNLLKEGTCTVTAQQAGNTRYLEASAATSVLVKTNQAIFSAKVLSNKDTSGQLTQVSQLDTVNVSLKVVPAPRDMGKNADLFLTVKMGTNWFILTPESWKAWDTTTLTPVKQATLNGTIEVPIFSGQLPIAGNLEFYAAYRLVGNAQLDQGTVQVLTLTVNEANPVELAKANCLGQNGVYYAQRCFTDAKNLGNSFAGGIYQSEQNSLQTSVNLACRLGKKVAVLGRFNPSATDIGKTAEVILAFALGTGKIYQYDGSGFNELTDIAALSGKPIGALPAVYSAAFFEGELPTTGNFATFLGYRLLNSDGTKGELKYAGGLSLSAPIESCDNPSLKLNTLPLGTGKGEVITKANDDGTVRLIATAATDGSAFAGWTGDAEGCQGTETTVTIKPSADKFTCQPTFSRQVLGTLKCENGFDTEQNIACCDPKDPKCPVIPEPCNPPEDPNTQWLLNIPPSDALDVVNIRVTNLSQENREVKATLYDEQGKVIFADKTLVEAGNLPQFAAVRIQMADLTSNGENWKGRGKLKIPNSEGLLIQLFLRAREATGFPETPLMNMTFASAKHRVTAIPPPQKMTGADALTIRINNIGDTEMKLGMRLFSEAGGDPIWVGTLVESLPKMDTSRVTNDDLAKTTEVTWEGRAFAEIFPEDVKQRCNGKMLMQNLVRQNGIRMAPLSNITPD